MNIKKNTDPSCFVLIGVGLFFPLILQAQVGINTTTPSTVLDVAGDVTFRETIAVAASNTVTVPNGFSQIQLIGSASGTVTITPPAAPALAGKRLIIFNNTTGGFTATMSSITIPNGQALEFIYSNGGWRSTDGGVNATAGSTAWKTSGNAGTIPGTHFIGTTDAQDWVIKTNNTERVRVLSTGNVGINTIAPSTKLHITGDGTNPPLRIQNLTSIIGPYSALAANTASGDVGLYTPGAQPIMVVKTKATSTNGDWRNAYPAGASNITIPISVSSSTPLNTLGGVLGSEAATITGFASATTVHYIQVPQSGTYDISMAATFDCQNFPASGSYAVNVQVIKANGSAVYTEVDNVRGVVATGTGLDLGRSFPMTIRTVLSLAANDKIAFRFLNPYAVPGAYNCGLSVAFGSPTYNAQAVLTKL